MNVKEYCMEMNDRAMLRRESKKLMFRRHAEEQYRERVRTGYCQFDRDDIQVDPDAPVSMTTDDEDRRGAGAWVLGVGAGSAQRGGERMNAKAAAGRIEKACKCIAHLPNMTLNARIIRRELTSDEEFAARFLLHVRHYKQQQDRER